jgi:hypothetical protein
MRPDPDSISNDTVTDIIILRLKDSRTGLSHSGPDDNCQLQRYSCDDNERAFIASNNKGRQHSMQNNRISASEIFCLKNPQPKLSQSVRHYPHRKKLHKTAECFSSLNAKQKPLSYGKNVKLSLCMSWGTCGNDVQPRAFLTAVFSFEFRQH